MFPRKRRIESGRFLDAGWDGRNIIWSFFFKFDRIIYCIKWCNKNLQCAASQSVRRRENIDSNNTRLTSSNNHVNEASRVKNEIHDIRRADNLFMRRGGNCYGQLFMLGFTMKNCAPVFRVFSSMVFRKEKNYRSIISFLSRQKSTKYFFLS